LSPNAKVRKRGTFSEVLGVSTSAEVDEGRRPFNPRELLKKLDQNFSACNSPISAQSAGIFVFSMIQLMHFAAINASTIPRIIPAITSVG